MRPPAFFFVLVFAALAASQTSRPTSAPASRPAVDGDLVAAMRRHITALSAPEMKGRFGPGAEPARRYIEKEFETLGLEAVGPSYRHMFAASGLKGINLLGRQPATEAGAEDRHVIVSAHYDHLGTPRGVVHPGAADNASGVATMLEVARRLKDAPRRRSILYVAFDLEERGLLGSFAWVERPPVPLERCDFFLTVDIVGRDGLGLLPGHLFVQGWEWTPGVLDVVRPSVERAGLEAGYFWTDIAGDRSDFVAFKRAGVPHLFFSTGENEDYHRPTDRADRIDLEAAARAAACVADVTRDLANRETAFTYRKAADMNLVEFHSLRRLAKRLLRSDHPVMTTDLRGQALALGVIASRVIKRGEVRPNDRKLLLNAARRLQGAMR